MNFEFVGKLSVGKETDKFKPYEENIYNNQWKKKRFKFNAQCGDNRHFLTIDSFEAVDGSGQIYTFSKGKDGAKGEKLTIPFSERLTSPKLSEVADFKKMVVDLGDRSRRYALKKIVDKMDEGDVITDEELEEVGLDNESAVKKEYEASLKLHREFIAETDFLDFVKKVVESGKYNDKKFKIRGSVDFSYSDAKGEYYTNIIPQKIYLADEDEKSVANLLFLFGADSLDKTSVEDKYVLHGWTMYYDNQLKKNAPAPIDIVIAASDKEKADKIARRFESVMPDEIREMGIEVHAINGSGAVEITPDMLNESQKELLDLGMVTMEELRKELGGSARGEVTREYRLKGFTKGYTSGSEATSYAPTDMKRPVEEETDLDSLFDI